MKDYLLKLLETCAPENGFAQDAIEHAIVCGNIHPTMNFADDVALIMSSYDEIIVSYRKAQPARDTLINFYEESGFLAEITGAVHRGDAEARSEERQAA